MLRFLIPIRMTGASVVREALPLDQSVCCAPRDASSQRMIELRSAKKSPDWLGSRRPVSHVICLVFSLGRFTHSHILAKNHTIPSYCIGFIWKKHKLILYYSTMVTITSSSERRSIRRPSQAPSSSYASPRTVLHRFVVPSSTPPSHPEEEERQYESSQFEGAETRDMMTMMRIDLDTMSSKNKPQPRQLPSSLYLPSF
jgi:hypothetical protein